MRGVALTAILALVGCAGADGKDGAPGAKGDPGPAGTAGPAGDDGHDGADGKDAVTIGDVTGAVTDGTSPLEGVAVTASGSTATASTDAQGKFTLKDLAIGAYEVTFSLAGYLDQTLIVTVTAGGSTNVSVSLAVDPKAAVPPSVTTTDNLLAGFGKSVTLEATATGKGTLSYQWTQLEGPPVTLTGDTTDTVTFTTQSLVDALPAHKLANARFGTLGVNPDEAGNYVFEVAVTDSATGLTTKQDVHVNATRPTSGLRNVPVGVPVWLQGDGPLVSATQTTWSWTIDKAGATGSTATLSNPTSQFPSFVPDVKGVYKLTESVSDKTMTIYAGTWFGEMTADGSVSGDCSLCHGGALPGASDNFTAMKSTRHYKGLAEKLDGVSTPYFAEECMSCHTVGYDKTASNNGFDDVQAGSGWSFPAKLEEGNWQTLVQTPKLGQLAGIQCESCHGPHSGPQAGPHTSSATAPTCTTNADCTNAATGGQGVCDKSKSPAKCVTDLGARISYASEVCANCHEEKPHHYKPGQWYSSKHGDLELAYADATVEARGTTAAHCGRCHTAQGYAQYVEQLKQGYTGNLTADGKPANGSNAATVDSLAKLGLTQAAVQSQTCAACHDPHLAAPDPNDPTKTVPAQLRVYDTVPGLPNGMGKISGAGTGMICMTCHNTRNGAHNDAIALTSYSAPHVPSQTDTMYGYNAYFMPTYTPSAHLAVKDTCAGCHYGVATDGLTAAKQDTNHSFTVDNTICKACHADAVDGEALQAANEMQLEGLAMQIGLKVKGLIDNALLPANGGAYRVRAWDPVSDYYSSTSASNVQLDVAPASIELFEVHGTAGFILHLADAVTIPLVDGSGNAAGDLTTKDVYVAGSNLKNAAGTTVLFTAGSDLMKAMWNYYLLHGDGTKGVHNPSFFNAVIAATSAKLAALP